MKDQSRLHVIIQIIMSFIKKTTAVNLGKNARWRLYWMCVLTPLRVVLYRLGATKKLERMRKIRAKPFNRSQAISVVETMKTLLETIKSYSSSSSCGRQFYRPFYRSNSRSRIHNYLIRSCTNY